MEIIIMADKDTAAAIAALIDDALHKLGKARLSMELAGDLLEQSKGAIGTAGDRVAAAAIELRELVKTIGKRP